MNHDYAHCTDYNANTCPEDCFRAQLVRDLEPGMFVSWASLIHTPECKINECCDTCKYKMKLEKWDYSQGGCIHTDYDGFACTVFGYEGVILHHVGGDSARDRCECYAPKEGGAK